MSGIKGYRVLSDQEIALINEAKTLAEQCGDFVARLRRHANAGPLVKPDDLAAGPPLDQRWVSIGATHLQEGFMALTRGIAQPTTF